MRSLALSLIVIVSAPVFGDEPFGSGHSKEDNWAEAQKRWDKEWRDDNFRERALASITVPAESEKITLPSGKVLDTGEVFLDELTSLLGNGRFFPSNRFIVKFDNNRGGIMSLISAERGIIKGPILVFHEGGALASAAAFADGSQTGSLLVFSPEGKRAVFGQFHAGRRDGYFCLFDHDGRLKLVETFKRDKLVSADAIKDDAVIESAKPDGSMPFGGPVAGASAELEGSLKRIIEAERKLKKALVAWDESLRRAAAADNALAARQDIIGRANARGDNSAMIGALREWSKGYQLKAAQ